MKRIEVSALIGIIVAVFIGSLTGFGAKCDDIRDNLVRLHIIANSDSESDQELKLAVRDALLEESGELFGEAMTKLEAEAKIRTELKRIKDIAQKEITSRGYNYPVEVTAVNMYFNTREYDGFTVPAGRYDAVRLVIGEGNGKNWWCVMFPPMCVPAATEKSDLPVENELKELENIPRYKPKFAVVELIEEVKDALRGGGDSEWSDSYTPA